MGLAETIITWLLLLVSAGGNVWQSNINGELRAENEQLRAIAERCVTDRNEERNTSIRAADERERESAALGVELARSQHNSRTIVANSRGDCGSVRSPRHSDLHTERKRVTDSVNGVWLRGATGAND